MLLLRDFFLDVAMAEPTSMVAFSFSADFRGEDPLVDLRGRRVAGRVVSAMAKCSLAVTNWGGSKVRDSRDASRALDH